MSVRFLSLLAVLGAFLLLLPQPTLARDSVDALCHRHCAGEYDRLVTAKEKLKALEKRIEAHEKRTEQQDTDSRALNGKIGSKRRECAKLRPGSDAWGQCQKELGRLEEERRDMDEALDEKQSTRGFMDKKHKKLDEAVGDAQQDYDDCMKKCRNTPAIYEKIPDSVLGDLSTAEQRRKWEVEAKAKAEKEEAARAKCQPCEKARTSVAREADRLNELDKEYDELEAEDRRLRDEKKMLEEQEKLNRLRQEKRRVSPAQAKKTQTYIDGRQRDIDDRLKSIRKLQNANEDAQDDARRDLKRARDEQKKCNDKCTSGDKKSFLQGVLPGLSIGIGTGGGRHYRREHHPYPGGELEHR